MTGYSARAELCAKLLRMFYWMSMFLAVVVAALILSNWLPFASLRDTERKHKLVLGLCSASFSELSERDTLIEDLRVRLYGTPIARNHTALYHLNEYRRTKISGHKDELRLLGGWLDQCSPEVRWFE